MSDDDDNHLIAERRAKLAKLRDRGIAFPNEFRRDALAADLLTAYGEKSAEVLEAEADPRERRGPDARETSHGQGELREARGCRAARSRSSCSSRRSARRTTNSRAGTSATSSAPRGSCFAPRPASSRCAPSASTLITKSLRPLPDKWHGIADTELRYRRRYVDLIINEDSRRVFEMRSAIVRYLRAFLDSRGFLEVETPMLHPIPGGAAARPFKTHHNALDADMYLRIAPELYLKRLTVGGFERVYEINRNFRNEGVSTQHNPEFTMLELYQAYADYTDLMEMIEALFQGLADTLIGSRKLQYQGTEIDLSKTFARMTHRGDLAGEQSGSRSDVAARAPTCGASAMPMKIAYKRGDGPGKLQIELFEKTGEHTLVQPTFAYAYPAEVSPLSRRNDRGSVHHRSLGVLHRRPRARQRLL